MEWGNSHTKNTLYLKVVVGIGGSIFCGEDCIDAEYIRSFSVAMLEASKKHKMFIVAGGGKTARTYIEAGRELGYSEDVLDLLGVYATRLNAMIISASLGEKGLGFIPEEVEDVDTEEERIVVMGGTVPGHSTDAVAAMLAAHVDAELLIIATDVDGVYERDPKKDPTAKRFEKLSTEKLIEIVKGEQYRAGSSGVVDLKAAKIIHEKGLKAVVVDGRDVRNITDAIDGKVSGTVIEKAHRS
ncbi:MAG: UMP kinase [Candidatus Hydrothermarchaeales archaeon]